MLKTLLLLLNMTSVPRLTYRLMLDRRIPLRLKLMVAAAIAYVISPIDLLPHMLPGIDDLIVIILALGTFLAKAPKDILIEHIRRNKDSYKNGPRPHDTVIEGSYRIIEEDKTL